MNSIFQPPRLESRREQEFLRELRSRAKAWLPDWEFESTSDDFGNALLEVVARFEAEVAERLDLCGEKVRRGFLDWLGMRGHAAIPARLPIAFVMNESATQPALALTGSRVQADLESGPIYLETVQDVNLVPAKIGNIVAIDGDRLYTPPPGLTNLGPIENSRSSWKAKPFAPSTNDSTKLDKIQISPEGGIAVGDFIQIDDRQYRVGSVEGNLITINPSLISPLYKETHITKVTEFSPFSGAIENTVFSSKKNIKVHWQEHNLLIGDEELLNIESQSTIEIFGLKNLPADAKWEFWGKSGSSPEKDEPADWRPMDNVKFAKDSVSLVKPKGAIELLEIEGRKSRWIRASIAVASNVVELDQPISLKVSNSDATQNAGKTSNADATDDPNKKIPAEGNHSPSQLSVQGFANTTPLVMDRTFSPLGLEPKQFDAFYLGCGEAFSKRKSNITLHFSIADQTFSSLSVVPTGTFANRVFAGIGKDLLLYIKTFDPDTKTIASFNDFKPLQPPSDVLSNIHTPLPIWDRGNGIQIAVPSGKNVYLWNEERVPGSNASATDKSWVLLPSINEGKASTELGITGLAVVASNQESGQTLSLFAVSNKKLYWIDPDKKDKWTSIPDIDVASICSPLQLPPNDIQPGIMVVSKNGALNYVTSSGEWFQTQQNKIASTNIPPAACWLGNDLIVAMLCEDAEGKFVSVERFFSKDFTAKEDLHEFRVEGTDEVKGISAIKALESQSGFEFAISVLKTEGQSKLLTLAIDKGGLATEKSKIDISTGNPNGAPVLLAENICIPGTSNDLHFLHTEEQKLVKTALKAKEFHSALLVKNHVSLEKNDRVIDANQTSPEPLTIDDVISTEENKPPIFLLDKYVVHTPTHAYREKNVKAKCKVSGNKILGKYIVSKGERVLIVKGKNKKLIEVSNQSNDEIEVENIPPDLITTQGDGTKLVRMLLPEKIDGELKSMILPADSQQWSNLVNKSDLSISVNQSEKIKIEEIIRAKGDNIGLLLGAGLLNINENGQNPVSVTCIVNTWSKRELQIASNPELSWEYWNGSGWSALDITKDLTGNLRFSNEVTFTVPNDISSGDWAGKENYWIRARLIGGDYGQEKVEVTTVQNGPGADPTSTSSTQTIRRSRSGISPPLVTHLAIKYIVDPSKPSFVLTKDSNTIRDQSEANRTQGATVDAFLSFQTELETRFPNPNRLPASERSIFIGLDGPVSGPTISFFFKVADSLVSSSARLCLSALTANRESNLQITDHTRGLYESGLVQVILATPLVETELFGATRRWLRFTVTDDDSIEGWNPVIQGVYINGVWAKATETMTRELLGSSDGSPNIDVRVARPPILERTLELRVREVLSQSERDSLTKIDSNRIRNNVENLPGDWVLWDQVTDPHDESPHARVYSFDESTGEIQFGDGEGGMIPPIGRDNIVAFAYQRTEQNSESHVPANGILARTPLSLVSPIVNVESAFAVGDAAGGAAAENADIILSKGFEKLRHRDRIVSLKDLEQFAVMSSAEISQARAIQINGRIELTVVQNGESPTPTSAQLRALKQNLLTRASSLWAADRHFKIVPPKIRRFEIEIEAMVESIDQISHLSSKIRDHIGLLFGRPTANRTRSYWPLGTSVSVDQIGSYLAEYPEIISLKRITVRELGSENEATSNDRPIAPGDLILLSEDSPLVTFQTRGTTS